MEEQTGRREKIRLMRADVLLVAGVFVTLLVLLLPAIQSARESARRMACSNNFRQIGVAIHNYHSTYDQLPSGCGGTGPTPGQDGHSNQRRLSGLVALVPFLESNVMWETISNPYLSGNRAALESGDDIDTKGGWPSREYLDSLAIDDGPLVNADGDHFFPAMGPAPWLASTYPPFQAGMWTYRCPSDSANRPDKHAALTNYAMCYGDGVHEVGYEPRTWLGFRNQAANSVSQRGMFGNGIERRFTDVLDGLGSTIAMAEIVTLNQRVPPSMVIENVAGLKDNPSKCLEAVQADSPDFRFTPDGKGSRGGNWADGAITWSGVTTVLPPNSPSCDTETEHRLEGVFSSSSYHLDGCHVLLGDGAVKLMTQQIDTGNLTAPSVYRQSDITPPSPYGIWGSLGTIAAESNLATEE